MYHSITFGDKNTWDDWHLIPKSRPIFMPPTVKTNFVSVPGGDYTLDLTEALTGKPTYNNRTGSFEFYTDPDFKGWSGLYAMILNYLHGKRMRAVLEDDDGYYYEGRFQVTQPKSEGPRSSIAIEYNVGPYKWDRRSTGEGDWLWDPFNFEMDTIRDYTNIAIDGTRTVVVHGYPMVAKMDIIVSENGMQMQHGEHLYTLRQGRNEMRDVFLESGENTLTFTGNGIVTIDMRGGYL